jgi:hypothetical protein
MTATHELKPGMRVQDPTDSTRTLTVDRFEEIEVVHNDDTKGLRVYFRYPYERDSMWSHRDHEWTVIGERRAPEPILGTEYSALALTEPKWAQRLVDEAKRAVTE